MAGPLVLAIDIKALGTYLAPMFADGSSKSQQAKIVFSLFDQIIFSSGKAEGKQLETIFEIKMADSEQNSLTTISKLISSMSKH